MPWLRLLLLLLPLLLPAAPATAQQPTRPVTVDSKEECASLGGAWVGRGDWQHTCQVPWGREECLGLGGSWTPMVAAPQGGMCIARISLAAVGRQCTAAGGNWGPPGSAMPFCRMDLAESRPAPVQRAPDADRPCAGAADCTYGCVYRGPHVAPGADVIGRCRPSNARGGCYDMVEGGRLVGQICQ